MVGAAERSWSSKSPSVPMPLPVRLQARGHARVRAKGERRAILTSYKLHVTRYTLQGRATWNSRARPELTRRPPPLACGCAAHAASVHASLQAPKRGSLRATKVLASTCWTRCARQPTCLVGKCSVDQAGPGRVSKAIAREIALCQRAAAAAKERSQNLHRILLGQRQHAAHDTRQVENEQCGVLAEGVANQPDVLRKKFSRCSLAASVLHAPVPLQTSTTHRT